MKQRIAEIESIGWQAGFGKVAGFELFNVLALSELSDALALGSSVSLAMIERAGFVAIIRQREQKAT